MATISIYMLTYLQLHDAVERYHITADNTFNWDEKGFLIGHASSTQRIMSLEAYLSGRIQYASEDGSREFVSLLACIGATGTVLPPALIYRGDSGSLQDTWLEDWVPGQEAFFATSSNGWTSDSFGRNWLQKIFQRYTSQKAGRKRRLLLVDGHSSHVNMEFILLCDSLRILLLILPPHSTHRLQPLDVSLFSPLATYYTQGLTQLMYTSLGIVSMSKRSFWSVFWPAWQRAFTPKNIASGFAKTGIFPYNPSATLDKITKPRQIEAVDSLQTAQTPMTCRGVRRLHRQYANAPTPSKLGRILRANERLAAKHTIGQHMVRGLVQALKDEKKRRKRGKRLNLLGQEGSGPQFFSPSQIQAARDYQASKDAEEEQRQQQIIDRRAQAATRKKEREEERERKKQAAAEARAVKAAERQAQKELAEAAKKQKKQDLQLRKDSTRARKDTGRCRNQARRPTNVVEVVKVEGVVSETSRGRRVQRPQRFLN